MNIMEDLAAEHIDCWTYSQIAEKTADPKWPNK